MRSLTVPPKSAHERALFDVQMNLAAQSNDVFDSGEGPITSLYHTISHPNAATFFMYVIKHALPITFWYVMLKTRLGIRVRVYDLKLKFLKNLQVEILPNFETGHG